MKGLSKIIGEQEEKKRQKLQEDLERKNEENKKMYEKKLSQVEDDFKEKIKQQNRLNNNLKIQINMQSIEYENKIQKMTKLNEEENKKNKEKIQNLNESIRKFDEKEKTFCKIKFQQKMNITNLILKSMKIITKKKRKI